MVVGNLAREVPPPVLGSDPPQEQQPASTAPTERVIHYQVKVNGAHRLLLTHNAPRRLTLHPHSQPQEPTGVVRGVVQVGSETRKLFEFNDRKISCECLELELKGINDQGIWIWRARQQRPSGRCG